MSDDWVWGRHSVLEALRAGAAESVAIVEGRATGPEHAEILELAAKSGIAVTRMSASILERKTSGGTTQGIAARVRATNFVELDALLAPHGLEPAFLLALDQIQDPQNLGALLRTADAAGVNGVILPARRSAALSGAVARASAGASAHVRTAQVTNLVRALDLARRRGVWAVGLDAQAETPIYELDLTAPLLLVLGSEGSGLRRLTREHCDFLAKLPMRGQVGSLNVSAAGAIAMYEVVRQRMDTMGSS